VSGDDIDFQAEVKSNPGALAERMDVTLDSDVKRVYEATMSRFGRIDVVINNAVMRTRDLYPPTGQRTIMETEADEWQRMFDTNCLGPFRVIKAFVPAMMEQRSGSIINVGSSNSAGTSLEGPYQPSKAAANIMTNFLAHELKPYNIAANVLLPGYTRTTGSDEQSAARAEARSPGQPAPPQRRLRPESAVPLALFLAEQDPSGVTGQHIEVMRWNAEQGLGGFETWGYGPDIEAARAAGTL
jgi:NAD(P)-dependent dehydrogenase (short-subunit alcohol dehydrogenase family)